jgi:hypothetical protein
VRQSLVHGEPGNRPTPGGRCDLERVARVIVVAFALVLACSRATLATEADDLHRAQTIVTGQGEANRLNGFAACLEDVLIKRSGALQLANDPRLAPYRARAKDFVVAFDYRDEKSGKPKNDEQGTRDRSFFLIVDFDAQKIDELLASLGLRPWLSRPGLLAIVTMEQGPRQFIVTADAKQSELQRQALLAGAARRGMRVLLPDEATLSKAKVDTTAQAIPPAALAMLASTHGEDATLVGHLTWDDNALGWIAEWRLEEQGRVHRWPLRAETFDEVFRRAIGGAAQILSGNGEPG